MTQDMHYYEPAAGHGLAHDPFNSIVGPRPIGWIATRSPEGVLNLAPYSFFNAFSYTPALIGFSSNGYKDSVRNAEATGEFVWNLATRPLAEKMNLSASIVPHEVDEFDLAGLTPVASRLVKPPRVGESPVAFECKVTQIVRLKNKDGVDSESWMTFGEVVAVHIDKSLIKDGVYDTAAARPILRGGGPEAYFEITEDRMFRMRRP
ncbi:flavin reductase family protein [Pigmentiphaga aceris]|uniref:Flavin reductase family protein n=1 Tax=Pigmentiphaga aceris TaxID=1940612 RepID=A0A5C0B4K6_9BURK|nr:flavin reductase family protein [Pigmentiphaga aceris]QEI07457.1 flavin reductase family protein [Pigmentiphaga aceris]